MSNDYLSLPGSDFFINNHIDDIFNSFSSVSELYSVVLDINRNVLVEPTGPATYLGEFHEIIMNPKYGAMHADIVNCIIDSKMAMYSEIDDGNPDSRIAVAPIFIDGRFYAVWILYAHTKAQNQKLFKAFDHMSKTADAISGVSTQLYKSIKISDAEEATQTKLDFEHTAKEIMRAALNVVANGDKSNILELYDNVGNLLDVDYIVYYKIDSERPGYMKLVDYWAKAGKGPEAEVDFVWDNDHYDLEIQEQIKRNGLIIDKNNMTNKMRVETFEGKARAIMVFPVYMSRKYYGRLIFIEKSRERVWTKSEINFAREITDMISKDYLIERRLRRKNKKFKELMDIFDTLPVYVFIRKTDSGEPIYVNPELKRAIGHTMSQQESLALVPNVTEDYTSVSNVDKNIEPIKKQRFTRYIERLGGTFDVASYSMKWEGESATIVVISPGK